MITLEQLYREVVGLRAETLQHWIANDWVRPFSGREGGGPEGAPGVYGFEEIDVARVRLIVMLQEEMRVDEEALPIVLSLLDQLHDARRRMHRLQAAIDELVPAEARQKLRERLRRVIVEPD
jgi:chaperone modulatory protein CbpM